MSLIIREMQIKMTLRFHVIQIRMAKIKKKKKTTTTTKKNPKKTKNQTNKKTPPKKNPTTTKKPQAIADAGENVEKEDHSSIAGGIASWYNHLGSSPENWK
jgi:rare lipoprotein A (peptidoglycan hydrolase)